MCCVFSYLSHCTMYPATKTLDLFHLSLNEKSVVLHFSSLATFAMPFMSPADVTQGVIARTCNGNDPPPPLAPP